MGNLYFRLMMCLDNRNSIEERLKLLTELFDKLSNENIVTEEECNNIIENTIEVLKEHQQEIELL